MREKQIYIKTLKKQNNVHKYIYILNTLNREGGGGGFVSQPLGGGCTNITGSIVRSLRETLRSSEKLCI